LLLACSIAFFTFGWALLPAVRKFYAAAWASGFIWLCLAFFSLTVEDSGDRTAFFWGWFTATVGLLVCLFVNPPEYVRRVPGAAGPGDA
jgi:peptidoglycan biosynthesis protein MviN/MurJ (putative lipid II flippase)